MSHAMPAVGTKKTIHIAGIRLIHATSLPSQNKMWMFSYSLQVCVGGRRWGGRGNSAGSHQPTSNHSRAAHTHTHTLTLKNMGQRGGRPVVSYSATFSGSSAPNNLNGLTTR